MEKPKGHLAQVVLLRRMSSMTIRLSLSNSSSEKVALRRQSATKSKRAQIARKKFRLQPEAVAAE